MIFGGKILQTFLKNIYLNCREGLFGELSKRYSLESVKKPLEKWRKKTPVFKGFYILIFACQKTLLF